MTSKDSIQKRLAHELALEQYSYDLLRDRVNQEIENRNRQRKEEIQKQLIAADTEYLKSLHNADAKVLKQVQDKKNLAEAERKIKAKDELVQESNKLQTQKVIYQKLVLQDTRISQIMNELKSNSEAENLKEEILLKNLQQKREGLLFLINESQTKQQALIEAINNLQSQL